MTKKTHEDLPRERRALNKELERQRLEREVAALKKKARPGLLDKIGKGISGTMEALGAAHALRERGLMERKPEPRKEGRAR